MPVKIRLMRIGATKRPFYRVVAVDERKKRTGAYLELLGTYNPLTEPKEIILKQERIDAWIKQGAQPSYGFLRIIGKAPQRPPRKPRKGEKRPEEAKEAQKPSSDEQLPAEPKAEHSSAHDEIHAPEGSKAPVVETAAPEISTKPHPQEETAAEAQETEAKHSENNKPNSTT